MFIMAIYIFKVAKSIRFTKIIKLEKKHRRRRQQQKKQINQFGHKWTIFHLFFFIFYLREQWPKYVPSVNNNN